MEKPDRDAFARRNARWLVPVFVAILALGVLRENWFAVAAGVLGLLWIGRAYWVAR